ncbi:DEKNAAC105153 [Brettanomyces naardenensis]|uniref:DEKNAAC105153 n=1 Tax=Brettanomyces naardenensis TaxID=13370 RepID=A0A448YSW1_BRENA|nr:DEKNAAC105153 [Brettanomyces naardenensis]
MLNTGTIVRIGKGSVALLHGSGSVASLGQICPSAGSPSQFWSPAGSIGGQIRSSEASQSHLCPNSFRTLTQYRSFTSSITSSSHSNPLGLPNFKPANTNLGVKRSLSRVKHILLVSSCKGGVGKSTVSTNLAIALRNLGLSVGLLDADIFGPSIPKLMNLHGEPRISQQGKLIPLQNYGVQTMSMGYLIPNEDSPIVWRGLMLQKALQQLLFDVEWNDLDVLVIDLPPGTGDVQITIGQMLKVSGAIIVSTSQDLALIDVKKGISMFEKVKIPIYGLVENMSVFVCPNCHHEEHLFGKDGVLKEAERLGIDYLGSIPLNREICSKSDEGFPIALSGKDGLGRYYYEIAEGVTRHLRGEGEREK